MKKKFLKVFFSAEYLFKIGHSLYIIGTSIYDIKDDVTKLRKEHGLLLIGAFVLIKSIGEIIEKMRTVELFIDKEKKPST